MTGKHGFLDALKQAAFEDEPAPPAPHTPPAEAAHLAAPSFAPQSFSSPAVAFVPIAAPGAAAPQASYSIPIDAGVVPDSDIVYKSLLAKTDFESTATAATIHKFLDPLKAIPDTVMPTNVKFKTAVLQAAAQAGLTDDGILGTFDTLKANLQHEKDAFAGKAQQFSSREVAGRQDQIQKITDQITQLQQQLGQLSNDLVDAQGKAVHAQSQFEAALQRRASEIDQQKALYASLLKG